MTRQPKEETHTAPATLFRSVTIGYGAHLKMAGGIRVLAKVIRACYGPKRRLVVSTRKMDSPILLSDTQRICTDFSLEDPLQNMGVGLLKQAVDTVHVAVGDGAATAAILFDELIHDGLRHSAHGSDPRSLSRGMGCAAKLVCDALEEQQLVDVGGVHRVSALLRTASLGDDVSTLLMRAIKTLGTDGIIHVKESKRTNSTLEISSDIYADRGLITPLLVTDTVRGEAFLVRPYIFLTDRPLSCARDIAGVLEQISDLDGALLVIAPSIEGEALALLVDYNLKRRVPIAAINAPEFGDQRIETLLDFAALTGGMVFQALGNRPIPIEYFGSANEVLISKDSIVIRGPVSNLGQIELRIATLEEEIGDVRLSLYDRERRQVRLGNLRKKRGWINLGAGNDVELGELLEKTQRVLHAIRSGHNHGVVAGSGSALLKAAAKAEPMACLHDDEKLGATILFRALAQPARQILRNAAINAALIEKILDGYADRQDVYDVEKGVWVDPLETSIVDSRQSLQCAVRTAASLASAFLLSGGVVHQKWP